MLKFESITPEILAEFKPHLLNSSVRLCDYTTGCLYLWRSFFNMSCTLVSNMLVCTSESQEHGICYTYPVGDGKLIDALNAIADDARQREIPLQFCCVPEDCIQSLISMFGQPSKSYFEPVWSDYLYPYENFCGYPGKALHSQRNHVNRFLREYPKYSFIQMTNDNIESARLFMRQNHAEFEKDADIANEELMRLEELFSCFKKLRLSGGLLYVNDNLIGLTIGEAIGDTLHVHVEKALTEFHGSYQMLAMRFAEMMKNDGLLYINRQDDANDEGLKKSKLSYKPCRMLNKYYLIF